MVCLISKDISPFRLVYYGFRLSGLMYDKDRKWSLIYTMYLWFITNTFGIASILQVYFVRRNVQDAIEALSCFSVYMMSISKLITFTRRGKDINILLDKLENVRIVILKDTLHKNYMMKTELFLRKLIIFVTIFLSSTPILSFFLTTIYDYMTNFENKRLMIQVWIPWSMEGIWPYLAAKIFTSIMTLTVVLSYSAFGCLELTFAYQISAYLKILQNYLEIRGPKEKIIYQKHRIIIDLITDYNRIFSGSTYLEILVAPLMPCGFGFTLLRALKNNQPNQLDAIQKMFGCMVPPIIACSCGQEIITQMERLHESSYMSKWYEETPKVRRDLLTLMIRTAKPTTVNYRLFVIFNRVCLASVFQGIYSYFMLVVNFDSV